MPRRNVFLPPPLGYKTLCERNIIHLMCIGFFCFLMHVSLLGTSCIFLDVNFPGTEMAGKGTTQFMNEKLAEETPMFSKVSTWALKTNLRCTVFVCMFFPFIHSWFLLLSQREYIPFVHFCSEAGDFFTGIFYLNHPPPHQFDHCCPKRKI